MTSELPREVKLDALGSAPRAFAVEASPDERAALARRFGLLALDRLEARVDICRVEDAVLVEGAVSAEVMQSCVATGVPLAATIREPFALRFVPASVLEGGDEIELGADELDVIGYSGGAVDIGEAVAETLGLAIDSFPRADNADAALRTAGVLSEADASPFAVLKQLKGRT